MAPTDWNTMKIWTKAFMDGKGWEGLAFTAWLQVIFSIRRRAQALCFQVTNYRISENFQYYKLKQPFFICVVINRTAVKPVKGLVYDEPLMLNQISFTSNLQL
jgi:hypothetical protein